MLMSKNVNNDVSKDSPIAFNALKLSIFKLFCQLITEAQLRNDK